MPRKILYTNKRTLPSARILRDSIYNLTGIRLVVTSREDHIKPIDQIFIRYGNSTSHSVKDTSLNSPKFIQIASSKMSTSNLLLSNGIYTPEYFRNNNPTFPCLIRQTLYGMGGKGIIYCKDIETFRANYSAGNYWTPYVFTDFELRVHVFNEMILRIFRKEPTTDSPIRNNDTCHFSLKNPERFVKLLPVIEKLYDIFSANGLQNNFYALDIGWDSKKKEYFTFELNSAPGLNENTADIYATNFARELNL